ncbi:hypothetical protein [Streptomyces sp. NPDC047071]|uniref:hypothetical protein n=1 Tax=Streptomyces sp. NPDC047071 TaxID=3154808 RepID=UPI003452AE0B
MAKKKLTITIDNGKVAAIEGLVAASPAGAGSVSAWIEEAVTARLEQAERAERAVEWLVSRAQAEHPGEWEQALAAVRAADERHGFTTGSGEGQSAA